MTVPLVALLFHYNIKFTILKFLVIIFVQMFQAKERQIQQRKEEEEAKSQPPAKSKEEREREEAERAREEAERARRKKAAEKLRKGGGGGFDFGKLRCTSSRWWSAQTPF